MVTGGAASGKSAFAERLACSLPGPHAYVATMRHGDAETEARIARHLRMREGKGFVTVELADNALPEGGQPTAARPLPEGNQPTAARKMLDRKNNMIAAQEADPPRARGDAVPSFRTVLLEDMGNLVANGLQDRLDDVLACENVVIVANEVGGDGIGYDPFTMEYIETVGALACELGARAELVVEVVSGEPIVVKGELPCAC